MRSFELFESDKISGFRAALANDVCNSSVVRHMIDPGAQRASIFEFFETLPNSKMDPEASPAVCPDRLRTRAQAAREPRHIHAMLADRGLLAPHLRQSARMSMCYKHF